MSDPISPEEEFIEEFGLVFDEMGIGRTPGRIISALMINDPPYMNMNELVERTSMSKGSISTGLNLLTSIGFVNRFSRPTERSDYYEIDHDFWAKAVMTKVSAYKSFRTMLGQALDLLEEDPYEERKQTLEEMYAMYQWFEEKVPLLFKEWEDIRRQTFGH